MPRALVGCTVPTFHFIWLLVKNASSLCLPGGKGLREVFCARENFRYL